MKLTLHSSRVIIKFRSFLTYLFDLPGRENDSYFDRSNLIAYFLVNFKIKFCLKLNSLYGFHFLVHTHRKKGKHRMALLATIFPS